MIETARVDIAKKQPFKALKLLTDAICLGENSDKGLARTGVHGSWIHLGPNFTTGTLGAKHVVRR